MLEDLVEYYGRTTHNKQVENVFFKKIVKNVAGGLVAGAVVTGVVLGMILGKKDREIEYQKQSAIHTMLVNEPKKDEKKIRVVQKKIQRVIYNTLQEKSLVNITEDVLEGKELYTLGMIYYTGRGVRQDYRVAFEYFKKASKYRLIEAELKLGDMYTHGKGVEKSKQKAIEYYEKAGKRGDARGYYHLGKIHMLGSAVLARGIAYFEKAASMGHQESIRKTIRLYTILNNNQRVLYYLKKGVDAENIYCLKMLGGGFLHGKYGLEKNEEKGVEYMKKAIQYGDIESIDILYDYNMINPNQKKKLLKNIFTFISNKSLDGDGDRIASLGYMYFKGIGTQKNYAKAKEFFEKSAAVDNIYGIVNLAWMYYSGKSVKKNYSKAKELYERAVQLGHDEGFYRLGEIYYLGRGVKINYSKAKRYFEQGVELGNTKSMIGLANIYYHGNGVVQDYKKARNFVRRAISLGDKSAVKSLKVIEEKMKQVNKNGFASN